MVPECITTKSNYHENFKKNYNRTGSCQYLFTALSFSQREDATSREITTAAVMELYQHLVLSLYQPKKIMEQVKMRLKRRSLRKTG